MTTKASAKASAELNSKKKKKKKGGLDSASRKMANFAVVVGVLELAAFLVRLRKSITPDPATEGVVGIPEMVAVIAPVAGYFLFGYTKAPWGKPRLLSRPTPTMRPR